MRLGEMLLERKFITSDDLERALEIQKDRGEKLGKILVDLGFAAQRDVLATLAEQLNVPLVTLEGPLLVTPETEKLSSRFLRQSRVLPIAQDDGILTLAMADPLDFETLSVVRSTTGLRVRAALAAEGELAEALDKYYGESAKRDGELVIGDDGWNCGCQANRGCKQGFRDARRNNCEAGISRLRDCREGIHDAPNSAEQPDEGCGGPERCEERQTLFNAFKLPPHRAAHCLLQTVANLPVWHVACALGPFGLCSVVQRADQACIR